MNRKILGLTAALTLAAGCEFAEKTTWEGPIADCRTAGAACTANADCCSYGCEAGVCQRNPVLGGTCRTTDDCGYSSATQMLCKSGSCSVPVGAYYCRDDADVCDLASQCCSRHCTGTDGTCVPNAAPVVQMGPAVQDVPRNQPWTMVNTSYDPDVGETATLAYGWRITPLSTPPPDGGTLSSLTAKNPVFTPGSGIVSYRVDLDVTDTWGLTSSGTVTLNVINFPPAVTPAVTTVSNARNVPLTVQMTAADANGDSLTCTWSVCRPGTATCLAPPAAPAPFTALPGAPRSLSAAFPTGLVGTDEGPWDVALSCTDGLLTTVATTAVTVTNSPPVISVPATRTFNLDYVASDTAEQTVTASASDENGDADFTWTWEVLDSPEPVTLSGASTATAGFAPNVGGAFTLRVRACDAPASNPPYVDRPGSCDQETVVATVYPYIRPLTSRSGAVVDAAWRKSDGRLVAVGTDADGVGRLWVANPAANPATTPDAAVALSAAPTALGLSVDGLAAFVGEQLSRWQVASLGATPSVAAFLNGPFVPDAIVHHASNRGFAVNAGASPSVYELLPAATPPYEAAACTNCTVSGTYAASDGSRLWILRSGALTRYSVNNGNGDLTQEATTTSVPAGATRLWRSSDSRYLFLPGTNGILQADTLATANASLPAGATHADSSGTVDVAFLGVAATGSTVTPFNSAFVPGTPIALPHWGSGGDDRTLTARYAFVSGDRTRIHVVVESSATPEKAWGLYTCTLPCTLP